MLFNSIDFLIFFPIVLLVYYLIPNKIKYIWLLVSSYYFYMCWNAKYALLLLFSTIVTYLSGLFIEKVKQKNWEINKKENCKKIIVALSFIINLGILFFFKYFNFVFSILNRAFSYINIQLTIPVFDIILPVGISFFTFQALSYTMDVYRDEIYAEKNFLRYALFVSFFPQLVAGPIERSKNLLKQLASPKKFDIDSARKGILLMIWGFFLKMVLADRIAIFVDTVYGNTIEFAGCYLIIATVLFAVQIYCDFAGYSIIAMGAASIIGINLMENFDAPYLSTSVSEFWRRWHISLTSWFKDYLYIPLGGSRKGTIRKYINKMIVFLVSGLWHGASISFVVWGGLNGLYQIIEEATKPLRDFVVRVLKVNRSSIGHRMFQITITFILVDFSWIFFRANGFTHGIEIAKSIFTAKNFGVLFDGSLYNCGLDAHNFWLMIICISILIFADFCKRKRIDIVDIVMNQDGWFRWLFISASICFILLFGKWGPTFDQANFIYFQF